jgi:hypothetical protein
MARPPTTPPTMGPTGADEDTVDVGVVCEEPVTGDVEGVEMVGLEEGMDEGGVDAS